MNRLVPAGAQRGIAVIGLAVLSAAMSLGCDDGLSTPEPENFPMLGIIKLETPPFDIVDITVPDTVEAGSPFEVRVYTWKPPNTSCGRKGDTEATIEEQRATVTPYDTVVVNPSVACTDDIRQFDEPHVATLTFPEPGRGHVTFRGREERGTSFVETTVERTVVVR